MVLLSPPPLDLPHAGFSSNENRPPAYHEERMREGKVIKVQDVAFITYVSPPSVPITDRLVSPVSKRFCSTCTPVISSSRPSDQMPIAKPGLLKSFLLPQIVFLGLHLNPSTASPTRYLLMRPITRHPQLTTAAQYDVPTLKSAALREIEEGLERCDAVRETFGRFASEYVRAAWDATAISRVNNATATLKYSKSTSKTWHQFSLRSTRERYKTNWMRDCKRSRGARLTTLPMHFRLCGEG